MRVVVQRVCEATVTVDDELVERIGPGLVVLVGIAAGDSTDDVAAISAKLASLRIFRDADQKMNRSVVDVNGEILVVSQFTLLADVEQGPSSFLGRRGSPGAGRRAHRRTRPEAR